MNVQFNYLAAGMHKDQEGGLCIPGAHGTRLTPASRPAPGVHRHGSRLGYEIEPSGERALAGAMLREVITYWLTVDIDG